MAKLRGLLKAEYLFTPGRLAQRLLGRSRVRREDGLYLVPMRWGLERCVSRLDDIARSVDRLGVNDLVVTEAIWRLLAPGDTAIDVGANVGYMSLAIIARLHDAGRIFAFEPHPTLFGELARNLAAARRVRPGVEAIACNEALSATAGTDWLSQPAAFETNRGLSAIAARTADAGFEVSTGTLDAYAERLGPSVALAKIDVEGHEPSVLRGARGLLERGVIRHLVIEEHGRHPTESSRLLEGLGYSLFSLERRLFGPRLGDPARPSRSSWEPPSLLATRNPEEVRARFARPGWRCLHGSS